MAITDPPTIAKLKTEWGVSNSNLLAYLRNGSIVGSTDLGISGIATAAPLSLRSFLGAARYRVTVDTTYVSGTCASPGACTATSNYATVTVVGGTAPYSYLWQYVSGDTATLLGSTTAACAFRRSVTVGTVRSGVYQCRVTDNASNVIYAPAVSFDLENVY